MQPGHVFPLQAQDGGVLMRAGHTEAGCDLARMAGLTPAAVICEIMNDDGTMARLPDLKKFAKNGASFKDIDKNWLEDFKNYLQYEAKSKTNKRLSQNSQSSYFSKVTAALKEAVKEGIIQTNPANQVEGIKADDPDREFLTLEELQAAAKVECEMPVLKDAFIFSALTGLRWSDIEKLVWSEVKPLGPVQV